MDWMNWASKVPCMAIACQVMLQQAVYAVGARRLLDTWLSIARRSKAIVHFYGCLAEDWWTTAACRHKRWRQGFHKMGNGLRKVRTICASKMLAVRWLVTFSSTRCQW